MEGYATLQRALVGLARAPGHRQSAQSIIALLGRARHFEVEPEVVDLLKQTKNEPHETRTPFESVWVEAPFERDGAWYPGILLYEAYSYFDAAHGGWVLSNNPPEGTAGEAPKPPNLYYATAEFPDGKTGSTFSPVVHLFWGEAPNKTVPHVLHGDDATDEELEEIMEDRTTFLNRMVANFLDLVHTPDVELVQKRASASSLRRRSRKHGMRPPEESTRVVLTGQLREYVDGLKSGEGFRYGHRFQVRGHWRRLRHERYGENRGKRIWIPPYEKGAGIKVRSTYEVQKPRDPDAENGA